MRRFAAAYEDLGRLHRGRPSPRPAADHRAPAGRGARDRRDRARVRADAGDPRAARHPLYERRSPRRRLGARQGAGAGRALEPARTARLAAALRPRARPRLGRPGGRLRRLPDPLGADAGLRVRRAAAADQLPRRAPRHGPRGDPGRAARQGRGAGAQAVPLSGAQGGLLPGRLRARLGGAGGARTRSRSGDRRRPPAAGDLRVPRAEPAARARPRPPRRGAERSDGGDPAHRAAGAGSASPSDARRATGDSSRHPRPRHRCPEPDRLRRPGGQRGGDDEPGSRRPRDPRVYDLRRPHGRGRRAADRGRAAAGPARSGRAGAAQARGAGRRASAPATRCCWSKEPSEPSSSLDASRHPSAPVQGVRDTPRWPTHRTPFSPS